MLADLHSVIGGQVSARTMWVNPAFGQIHKQVAETTSQDGVYAIRDSSGCASEEGTTKHNGDPSPFLSLSLCRKRLSLCTGRASTFPQAWAAPELGEVLKKKCQGFLAEISRIISKHLTFTAPLESARTHYPRMVPSVPRPSTRAGESVVLLPEEFSPKTPVICRSWGLQNQSRLLPMVD